MRTASYPEDSRYRNFVAVEQHRETPAVRGRWQDTACAPF